MKSARGENNTNRLQPKKRLNIAMLGHKRIPSREGGVEIVVEELATRMVAGGHCVTCYNRRGHHVSGSKYDSDDFDSYNGVKLKKVWTINRKGFAAVTSSVFGAIAAAFGKYDVVHFHAEGSCMMLWLPKLFGKRCVATIHGLDWQRAKWKKGLGSMYIKLGEKIAVRFADELIVLSKGMQDYFRETYGRETVFIPNGVCRPEKAECRVINEKYGLECDDYILFLGRIVPEKGIHYLIDAYKGLRTNKKLVVAGGTSDTEEYMSEIKAMAGENVIFTDFVQGKELEELYSNCYLYCLPSDLEGMPLSLLEAMSYGNCCVVSDIAECTEVVEDKAAVFKKGSIDDLRKILQELCDDEKQVKKYRESAASFICRKYDWDAVVEETLKVYGEKQ